jgi:hypothetical protein
MLEMLRKALLALDLQPVCLLLIVLEISVLGIALHCRPGRIA